MITDDSGSRELSEQEVAQFGAAAEDNWQAFWRDLIWKPISEYDREKGRSELLRAGDAWAFGFWGAETPGLRSDDEQRDGTEVQRTWRDAQDSADEAPLAFEPEEFAVVEDQNWRVALMAD